MIELVGFHAYVEFKRFGRHRSCYKIRFRGTEVLELSSDYDFSASLASLHSFQDTASGAHLYSLISLPTSTYTACEGIPRGALRFLSIELPGLEVYIVWMDFKS